MWGTGRCGPLALEDHQGDGGQEWCTAGHTHAHLHVHLQEHVHWPVIILLIVNGTSHVNDFVKLWEVTSVCYKQWLKVKKENAPQ